MVGPNKKTSQPQLYVFNVFILFIRNKLHYYLYKVEEHVDINGLVNVIYCNKN